MGTHMGHVFTLANSIIGVSVLAMPFCFRQCGILLSVLMLLLSSYISRLACHYLMKSAITERMKNFEMLDGCIFCDPDEVGDVFCSLILDKPDLPEAQEFIQYFYNNYVADDALYPPILRAIKCGAVTRTTNASFRTFGPTGKLVVELSIVGFMLGTCVAFFVVIGDLGPNIIGPILGLEHPTALRPSVLIGTAVFVVLPLGLLRNVDSLNGICAVSLAFYGVLVLKVFLESFSNLFDPQIWAQLYYWRPSGLLRCVPIFSMALSCQTQLFEVFGSLPTTPLDRANGVVKSAVNLTTFFYISVGTLGYLAYANKHLTGNVMMNFSEGASSEVIKICFLLSVAVSFPLVIFPCRASIYSFLYSKMQHSYEGLSSAHIPETRFQCITLVIVTSSLVIGLMIPNIELVLGLVGSTLGVFICVITPGLIFTTISLKRNNERLLAKILVGTGMVVMVLGTYANLFATEETLTAPPEPLIAVERPQPDLHPQLPNLKKDVAKMEKVLKQLEKEEEQRKEEKAQEKRKEAKTHNREDKGLKEVSKSERLDVNVSPGSFSDQNPQPQKVDEGPMPQPVAPEPPEEPMKKVPINIPDSLPKLEGQKAPELEKKKVDSPIVLPEGTPEVIRKAVSSSGVMEKIAAAKKTVDPVQPVPPVDVPALPVLKPEEPKVGPRPNAVQEKLAPDEKEPEKPPSNELIPQKTPPELVKLLEPAVGAGKEQPKKSSNTKENEIIKAPLQLPQVEEKPKPPKDNLSMSMAQGVPLPLAIKGLEDKKKSDPASDQLAKVGRDILVKTPDEPEQREKRDLEATEKEEIGKTEISKIPKSKEEVSEVNTEPENIEVDLQKVGGSREMKTVVKHEADEDAVVRSDGRVRSENPVEKPAFEVVKTDSHLLDVENHLHEPREQKYQQDEEECPKTTVKTEEDPKLDALLKDHPDKPLTLIKTPSKLTNELPILPGSNWGLLELKERPDLIDIKNLGKRKK